MTHEIRHPNNWNLLDDLHTYLWKLFPLDRFDFTMDPEAEIPEYAGTEPAHRPNSDHPKEIIMDDVQEAVRAFVNGGMFSRAESANAPV